MAGVLIETSRSDLPLGMQVENLLKDLLVENFELDNEGKEGVLDVLYSKRSREKLNHMMSIAERMDLDNVIFQQKDTVVSSHNEIFREMGKAVSHLAAGRKRLRLCDLSWHPSICYPLPRDSIGDEPCLQAPWDILHSRLGWAVVFGRLTEDVKVICRETNFGVETDITDSPDVVSLLSLCGTLVDPTGEQIILEPDTFEGKYVMVFCIDAPALFGIDENSQCLLNLCNELSLARADVKMVMVARMNILADTKEVFDHLFSGFPTSCLAIPYEDWERRERVCKLLECRSTAHPIQCRVYNNTDGSYLSTFDLHRYETPYGAEAFPFTEKRLKDIDADRKRLQNDSLDKLLRPYETSNDVVMYELNGPQRKTIAEVMIKEKKHVGLYVCSKGNFIPFLKMLYLQCKEDGKEFEIVVLYLPLFSNIDPGLFKEKMESRLLEENISGWCLPFNNSVSLRFWGLTMDYEKFMDKMIIVGPDGKILDLYGSMVIERYDWYDAYPFTRDALVEKKIKEVKEVRLEPLLEGELFRGDNLSDTISAQSLLSRGKKIIIFMGHPRMHVALSRPHVFDSEGFVSEYGRMKKERGDEFEVVFIEYPVEFEFVCCKFVTEASSEAESEGEGEAHYFNFGNIQQPYIHPRCDEFGHMPWYIHRREGSFTALAEKLKELVREESLVGFGEDGCICSIKLLSETNGGGGGGPCLRDDTLKEDVYALMKFGNM